MKKALAIVLSVITLISLCACSLFGGTSLKGTEWKLTSMKVEGLVVDEEFLSGLGMDGTIVFDDKQATISVLGESDSVDYSVKDNTVDLGGVMTATIDGDTLIIDAGEDGIMYFTKG